MNYDTKICNNNKTLLKNVIESKEDNRKKRENYCADLTKRLMEEKIMY